MDKMRYFSTVLLAVVVLLSGCVKESVVCRKPYMQAGSECCLDKNDDRVCDKDKPETSILETTTSSGSITDDVQTTTLIATTVTYTSVPPTIAQTTLRPCKTVADCGEPYYYEDYTCHNSRVTKLKYKPLCQKGSCILRSEVEVFDKCESAEKGDDKKMCVDGFSRCITKKDYKKHLTIPEDAEILEGISSEEYNVTYEGYGFRINQFVYPANDVDYYKLRILLDIRKPGGAVIQREVAWDSNDMIDDIEIGMVIKTTNRKPTPVIWVQ